MGLGKKTELGARGEEGDIVNGRAERDVFTATLEERARKLGVSLGGREAEMFTRKANRRDVGEVITVRPKAE